MTRDGINAKAITSAINGGEPYAPGTRFEYTDEFVVGAEHQFRGGDRCQRSVHRSPPQARDRRPGRHLGRRVSMLAARWRLNYYIGNPSSKSDLFVNPNEQVFGGSGTCNGSQGRPDEQLHSGGSRQPSAPPVKAARNSALAAGNMQLTRSGSFGLPGSLHSTPTLRLRRSLRSIRATRLGPL